MKSFNKENIKKVLIIAGVLASVVVSRLWQKSGRKETAENANSAELLKRSGTTILVVALVFPQSGKSFLKIYER